jgi:hypothetical protein
MKRQPCIYQFLSAHCKKAYRLPLANMAGGGAAAALGVNELVEVLEGFCNSNMTLWLKFAIC